MYSSGFRCCEMKRSSAKQDMRERLRRPVLQRRQACGRESSRKRGLCIEVGLEQGFSGGCRRGRRGGGRGHPRGVSSPVIPAGTKERMSVRRGAVRTMRVRSKGESIGDIGCTPRGSCQHRVGPDHFARQIRQWYLHEHCGKRRRPVLFACLLLRPPRCIPDRLCCALRRVCVYLRGGQGRPVWRGRRSRTTLLRRGAWRPSGA